MKIVYNLYTLNYINKLFIGKLPMNQKNKLSYEYIRGLVEGEGCFSFSTRTQKITSGYILKARIPTFEISMHERDQELITMIRDTLNLTNKIYNYKSNGLGGGRKAVLIVREFGSLKNIIIPFFYKKLKGYKGKQFNEWLEKINNDTTVPKSYKLLYRLHKSGFYDRNLKFLD